MKYSYYFIALIFLLISAVCCTSAAVQTEKQQTISIRIQREYAGQIRQIENLQKSMTAYRNRAHPVYTEQDIEKCGHLLIEFLKDMDTTTGKEEGMAIVKATVIMLNELNAHCDFQLIETGEREQIADIIISTGKQKGYNASSEDITEAWREW